ncbi:MAG: DNA repair protein RecO [Clostridiaceae bacterium]|nr:DNA repair protein RecO [Clostridiaceae bacterium]
MSSFTDKGLVLSAIPFKESDRMIRILSRRNGIISAIVPGAGKMSSRNAACARPGVYASLTFSLSHSFHYVSESQVIESFMGIYESIEALTAMAHILEITSDLAINPENANDIFPYVIYSLHALSSNRRDYRLIVSVFEWKIMDVVGFSVDITPARMNSDPGYVFSFTSCSIRTGRCHTASRDELALLPGTYNALSYIRSATAEKMFSFHVTEDILDQLTYISRKYLCERLDKKYCKLDMLDQKPF